MHRVMPGIFDWIQQKARKQQRVHGPTDAETDYSVASVDGMHTTKLLLDNKAIGSVIGSGGSVVNGIRQSSKARVLVFKFL